MNMYEREERNMPSHLRDKLLALEMRWIYAEKESLSQKQPEMYIDPDFPKTDVLHRLKERISNCQHMVKGLQIQLKRMRLSYQKLRCWRQVLLQFSTATGEQASKGDEMWAGIQVIKTNQKIQLVSPEKQFSLQYRIDTLMEEIKVADRAIAQLTA